MPLQVNEIQYSEELENLGNVHIMNLYKIGCEGRKERGTKFITYMQKTSFKLTSVSIKIKNTKFYLVKSEISESPEATAKVGVGATAQQAAERGRV